MRIVAEITHLPCRITLFAWNNKYIAKLEYGPLEQTYKIAEMDVTSAQEVQDVITSEKFVTNTMKRFEEMGTDFFSAF